MAAPTLEYFLSNSIISPPLPSAVLLLCTVYRELMSLHINCGFFLFVSVRMRTSGASVSCIKQRMSATALVLPRILMHAILTASSRSLPAWIGAGLQGGSEGWTGISSSCLLPAWEGGSGGAAGPQGGGGDATAICAGSVSSLQGAAVVAGE